MGIDNPNWDTRLVKSNTSSTSLSSSTTMTTLFTSDSFTVATRSPIKCHLQLIHQYEQGATNCSYRFQLLNSSGGSEANSQTVQVAKQGLGSNYAFGSHNMHYTFYNVAPGTYQIRVQGANVGNSNTTHITTYFSPNNQLEDRLVITYQA
jgi:hypothetical protein